MGICHALPRYLLPPHETGEPCACAQGFLTQRVLAKLNSKAPGERQEQRDPHYREADIRFGSWSYKLFSPPVSLLTEPMRCFPADLLLQ